MPKILITGGAGYIGSHTAVELLQAGYDVVIADNLSRGNASCIDGIKQITGIYDIPFYCIDCCNDTSVSRIFIEHRIDAVIHFAAYKAVGESVENPLMYYENNIGSFLTILSKANMFGVNNILFSSSCTVYGEPHWKDLPVTEQSKLQPAHSPYGNTKQICEDMLRDTALASEHLKGISLRYFNPIGAHPSGLIGESVKGTPNNLVPFITQTAIGKRPCLNIFGNDYPTKDGTCLRDYIDIVDLAKAHVAALNRMLNNGMKHQYEVFNIGIGAPVSVKELVDTFEAINDVKVNYKFVERRPGDVAQIWADVSLANRELNWKAERTIADSLKTAWAWEIACKNN